MAHDHPHGAEKSSPLHTSNAASTITIAGTNHPKSENHSHLHHTGRRLRHFLRPDGRKVHIVHSPDEAEKLRKDISRRKSEVEGWNGVGIAEKGDGSGSGSGSGLEDLEYDIVVHGSVDHIDALRETHSHHEKARDNLRIKHGKEFDEFERVVKELDRLSTELHMVSEHAVQLDANFDKFGYSAHLRKCNSSDMIQGSAVPPLSIRIRWRFPKKPRNFGNKIARNLTISSRVEHYIYTNWFDRRGRKSNQPTHCECVI